MHNCTPLVNSGKDKNKQLIFIINKPMQARIYRKKYVYGSVNSEGHDLQYFIHLCRQNPIQPLLSEIAKYLFWRLGFHEWLQPPGEASNAHERTSAL